MRNHVVGAGIQVAVLCLASILAVAQSGAPKAAAKHEARAAIQTGVTPRTQDGKPDLSGIWNPATGGGGLNPAFIIRKDDKGRTTKLLFSEPDADFSKGDAQHRAERAAAPNQPPYKPELEEKVKSLDENTNDYDGALHCQPLGVPRMGPPRQIVEYPGHMVFLYQGGESSINTFRVIPTDGRPHRTDVDPSYLGDSVGHWEGDTLVIDVVGFNDATWLAEDGKFHSDAMHVVERFTRDGDGIKYEVAVEDPIVFTRPWIMNPRILKLNTDPNAAIDEDPPCVEKDAGHLVTKEHH
jgi:hypothetical protein